MPDKRQIKVTLPKKQAKIIKELIGKKGNSRAEVVGRIVESWLENKGLLNYNLEEEDG